MIIILHDPTDDTFYAVDQVNMMCSDDWSSTSDEALTKMHANEPYTALFTMTIEQYCKEYSSYEVYYYDTTPQPYEYW